MKIRGFIIAGFTIVVGCAAIAGISVFNHLTNSPFLSLVTSYSKSAKISDCQFESALTRRCNLQIAGQSYVFEESLSMRDGHLASQAIVRDSETTKVTATTTVPTTQLLGDGPVSISAEVHSFRIEPGIEFNPMLAPLIEQTQIAFKVETSLDRLQEIQTASGIIEVDGTVKYSEPGIMELAGTMSAIVVIKDGVARLQSASLTSNAVNLQVQGQANLSKTWGESKLDLESTVEFIGDLKFLGDYLAEESGTEGPPSFTAAGTLLNPDWSLVKQATPQKTSPSTPMPLTPENRNLVDIKATHGENVRIRRAAFDRLVGTDGTDVLSAARMIPRFNGDHTDGLELTSLSSDGFFKRTGFRDGDILQAFGNTRVDSPEKGLDFIEYLAGPETRFRIYVRRGDKTVRKDFTIVDATAH